MSKDRDVLDELYGALLDNQPVSRELAAAFIEKYRAGYHGEIRSWDEVFGQPSRYGTGKRIRREAEEGRLIAEEIDRLKSAGISLNNEEFEAIGRRLKLTASSGTTVKERLRKHRYYTGLVDLLYRLASGQKPH